MTNKLPRIGIIGTGKVGQTLARSLADAGYIVAYVWNRNAQLAQTVARQVGAVVSASPEEVLVGVDMTLLTVADDAIASVAASIPAMDLHGKGVVHTSGAHDATVLYPLEKQGAMVGSLHPAFPFADVEAAVQGICGVTFAVEAETLPLKDWLVGIVHALQGRVLVVPPGQKARYHAALVFASNYTVTLYAVAQDLLRDFSDDEAAVSGALNALVGATLDNIRAQGVPAALTGPLVRGDIGTLRVHLDTLEATRPQLAAAYRMLAGLSLPMLRARGTPTEGIEGLLQDGDMT